LGVHWWTPTESTIPARQTIQVPELDLREVPKFEYRDLMAVDTQTPKGHLWMARNKMNGMASLSWQESPELDKLGGRYPFTGGHFLHGYNARMKESGMPIKEEMWSLVGGKRLPDSQPCLTNHDAVAAVAAGAIKELKAHPTAKFVSVGHEEQRFGYCQCANCAAVVAQEGPGGLLVQFANQVAELVEKEVPDGHIITSAYAWACEPPKTLKLRDSIVIGYDPLTCDYAHPLSSKHDENVNIENDFQRGAHYISRPGDNQRIRREIAGWSKIAKKLILYDYVGSNRCLPYPDLDARLSNMKYYADHGFAGAFTIGGLHTSGGEFDGLRTWLIAKTCWNPEADGKALLSEFLQGYYGPAAPAIQKYIDIMHKVPREHNDCYLAFLGTLLNARHLRPEIIADSELALRAAEKLAAGNPDLESRVRHAHMPIWYILAKRGPESVTWKMTVEKAGKLDFQELAQNFAQVVKERGCDITGRDEVELGPPFTTWLHDYAKLVAERGHVTPPELKGVDGKRYRLIQACQMDGVAGLWQRTEGASDGWCEVLTKPTFGVECGLTPGEDYVPGKKYKIFVRVKGEGKTGSGIAGVCNVYSPDPGGERKDARIFAWQMSMGQTIEEAKKVTSITKNILAENLADGQFHAIEIAEVANPMYIKFNFPNSSPAMGKVCLDCFWLMEVPETVK